MRTSHESRGIDAIKEEDEYRASNLMRSLGALKREKAISILAENGITRKRRRLPRRGR